ncbi:Ig-like domain-containing protein, partial [Curtobacterium sp. RIT-PI-V]|uniref:Ig-like domain-containing protein n=1 Tax=Curtobacterium sp. RIT-PI-V TaxID=3035296 RepID=UPI0021DAD85C
MEISEATVTVHIVDGGTLVGVDQGPIDLARGASTKIPMIVQNNESRANTTGTVTLTAPEGTTFDGQTRIDASWRQVGNDSWNPVTSIPLTNGRRSNDDKTITFDVNWVENHGASEQYRYMVNVTADSDAPAGAGQMGFVFAGDSNKGGFRAAGKTTTNLVVAQRELSAEVESVDHNAGSAKLVGKATPGATIVVGDQSAEVTESGDWELVVTDLTEGVNNLKVEQKIGDEVVNSKDLEVTINTAAVIGKDGTAVTLERGTSTKVEAQFTTQGSVSRPDAKVTFTAPEGTTFAEGQDTIQGSYRKPGEDWVNRSTTLTDGDLSMDGKTYTFTFKPSTSTWTLPDASLLRWNIEVETPAGAAEGTSSMNTKLVGTAVEGSFNATSTTQTTVDDSRPAAPSATGFFDTDVSAWAGVRGQGAANATIVVKNAAGEEIARTTANSTGSYEVRIDPNKVGFGEQRLVVTQTVDDATSDGMDVTLDYGQNDPQFTSPAEGGSLPNRDFTLEGTGN